MTLAQQIGGLVAAKCTNKLQITDSEFSKRLKAFFEEEAMELRTDCEASQQERSKVWRVGAFELVTAVVFAQLKMREKNPFDEWVLRAAVRNGLLVWRPDLETGKFTDQLWAKGLQLEMGIRRFPPEWLKDRPEWLTMSAEPLRANRELSSAAGSFSELRRWGYYNPEEDAENEVDAFPDLNDPSADELEQPLQNSLSLRFHPRLRRAAFRRQAQSQAYKQQL